MLAKTSPLARLREALAAGTTSPVDVAEAVIARANGGASKNTYITFEPTTLLAQASSADRHHPDSSTRSDLFGVPISLKDCFDLAGTITTAGSRFYADRAVPATQDSAMAKRLKEAGALITGKTHLHMLAYGITGQNPDYGDSLQPRNATLLTGGSSSGAAASVQEGSALAAIGTDTGGSIRVPAALCGLVGYRASHALAYSDGPWEVSPAGLWAGGVPLAPSFDTPGFLLEDPRDAAPLASALFGLASAPAPGKPRIGLVPESFLLSSAAAPEIFVGLRRWSETLSSTSSVLLLEDDEIAFWSESREVFGAIQAHEAAVIHAGHLDEFPDVIAQRLHFGAGLSVRLVADYKRRLLAFRACMAALFAEFDYLVVPCAPVSRLKAAEDQSKARTAILQYTTPFSLAGLPVLSLPGEIVRAPFGTGIQLIAAAGEDSSLLAYAAALGEIIAKQGDQL